MITAMSLTNGTLTVVRDGGAEILTARNDHPRWNDILAAFKARNEPELQKLLSLKAVVEEYSVGQLTVNSTGVLYHGQPVHTLDAERVMAFLRDGLPYKPLANYMAKLGNVSARVKAELYKFLEHKHMPITEEGKIIAYKGVRHDFYSKMGNTQTIVLQGEVNSKGQILNSIGSTIEVERSSVDDNYKNHCSFGLHAGSLAYAKGWADRVILIEIDPADVVSVPDDCNCQKLRCCKYKVMGEYTGPMPHAYAPEFSSGSPTTSAPASAPAPATENTPEREAMANDLRAMLAEIMVIDQSEINDATLFQNLEMDELDEIQLTMKVEEEYGLELFDFDVDYVFPATFFEFVNDIYSRVQHKKNSSFISGKWQGNADKQAGNAPTYLSGDETGADTPIHAEYIKGYLAGFN